jgi:hypothetical protein
MDRVDNEQNRTHSDHSNGNPTLFVLNRLIPLGDGIWIVENQNGGLKTNVVFAKVEAIFLVIPLKSHSGRDLNSIPGTIVCCQYICTYSGV